MTSLKEKIKYDVTALLEEGVTIHNTEASLQSPSKPKKKSSESQDFLLKQFYQAWYTKSLPVIKQILPDRYQEFVEQYKIEKRKEIDFITYTTSDYLIGLRVTRGYDKQEVVNPFSAFSSKFQQQLFILRSCLDRLDTVLADIQGTLQAELFDDELSADNVRARAFLIFLFGPDSPFGSGLSYPITAATETRKPAMVCDCASSSRLNSLVS
jgi:hypothetical protein